MIDVKLNRPVESVNASAESLRDRIKKWDRSDMLGRLVSFPGQLRTPAVLEPGPGPAWPDKLKNLVFCGLGGSGIAGDLVREVFREQIGMPVEVTRDYCLPRWAAGDTLVVLLSYSGNTEETLSACRECLERRLPAAAVTSGGSLADIARREGLPLVRIPAGFPPRTALGFLFQACRAVLAGAGIPAGAAGLEAALADAVESVVARCRPETGWAANPARKLAAAFRGTVPVFFSGGSLAPVAVRWKNQLEENAKALAFTGVLPEMNHNGVVGWMNPADVISGVFSPVFLRDGDENPRIRKRFEITRGLLEPRANFAEVSSDAPGQAARVFSLVALGDWTSYYLALEYGLDPTPVDRITRLKEQLAA
jgi:glucose/mannose-6-phosphate isomerase